MMKVCYSELDGPEGLSCRLEAAGHAGFAPAGQDIVCAGASTLMQALVYLLAGEENAHADAWEEPDGPRLAVQADAPCAVWVQGAFELAKAPFTCFYNALAAGFKSVGDARTPLRFLMVSAILNAALDLIFIGGLGFGIVCSAMTTVIAEAFSAVLAGWWLWTKTPELCPRRGQWRVDRSLLGRTLQYGGVSALQQAVQPIGKVLIQGQVNALGVEVIAAFNAVTRIDDFACIPEQSIAQGITTYIAQNRGAGRQDRIRRGFAVGLGMEAAYWMLIGGVVTLFKTPLAAMFVTGEGADRVIALAVQYLGTMALFYLQPAMTNGFQGYYRGIGNMPMTLLGTLIQTSLRVVTTCILAPRMGMYGIAFACATGWCVMLMVEVPFYFWQKARNE